MSESETVLSIRFEVGGCLETAAARANMKSPDEFLSIGYLKVMITKQGCFTFIEENNMCAAIQSTHLFAVNETH